jgi:hypothetical protein
MRLSQVIAVEKATKNQCNNEITAAYHEVQKPALFAGISRTYEPKDEEGERFPAEKQIVQKHAADLLEFTARSMTRYWDMTCTKDMTNTHAKADVVLDGHTIVKDAPVTFLLFLEKQLTDLATIIKKLPVLDSGETWEHDATTNAYATPATQSVKTKKVPRAFVKAAATVEHPAQVDTYTEDVVIGTWTTRKYSGALPQKRVTEILDRIQKLQAAVKMAREEANTVTVTHEPHVGRAVFDYVLGA